jgi:hypothetical protein
VILVDRSRIAQFFAAADSASTSVAKGKALEDLIVYLFGLIPGLSLTERNTVNAFGAEEVDVAFWNEGDSGGLRQFDKIVLIECKNWEHPVGSQELINLLHNMRSRGRPFGILVAAHGITGDPSRRTDAHSVLAEALRESREILVITRSEIESLQFVEELVELIKRKSLQLAVSGTIYTSPSS